MMMVTVIIMMMMVMTITHHSEGSDDYCNIVCDVDDGDTTDERMRSKCPEDTGPGHPGV